MRDVLGGDIVGLGAEQRVEVGGAVSSGEHELAGKARIAVEQKVVRLDFVCRGMGEGGARVLQVANERDQDKRNGCRALLAVHDGETGVAILVVALGGVEERSDEVLRGGPCGTENIEPELLALAALPRICSLIRWNDESSSGCAHDIEQKRITGLHTNSSGTVVCPFV